MAKNKFNVGDRVIMDYPVKNIGRQCDYKTGLALSPRFKEMNGDEFVITNVIYRGNPDIYRYTADNISKGVVFSYVYDEHWFRLASDIEDTGEVNFFT